ncbi:MAG: hypothetical protein LCI00_13270 [Chloroflexi bacterium]|jgi:hypothetical protein|nr:hypothetical protein [Chloroflexota bacterium]
MPSKVTKPQKPEDMLLRVIRVAEILAKSQGKTVDEPATNPPSNQTAVSAIQTQKTQP